MEVNLPKEVHNVSKTCPNPHKCPKCDQNMSKIGHIYNHNPKTTKYSTGFSSEIGTKLCDWAVRQARAGCYPPAALSTNDSETLYSLYSDILGNPPPLCPLPPSVRTSFVNASLLVLRGHAHDHGGERQRHYYLGREGKLVYLTNSGLEVVP